MQQATPNNTASFTITTTRLSDLISGMIMDKRRLGIHPDRIVDALKHAKQIDIAGAIQETGEYMVVMGAVTLTDAQQAEQSYSELNPGRPLAGYMQPQYMNMQNMGGYSITLAIFPGMGAEGVVIALNPMQYQGVQQLGETGLVNVILDVISGGQVNREVGFSGTYRGRTPGGYDGQAK